MKIRELINQSGIAGAAAKIDDFPVAGISCASAEVKDNFVFVAVKGSRADGHKFIGQAARNGAKLIIVQSGVSALGLSAGVPALKVKDTRQALGKLAARFYGDPARQVKTVGVTGTNGKTTVTYLIEAILKEAGLSCGVIGTVNYRFKDWAAPAKNTTPGPLALQSLLCQMRKGGISYCAMEVSSHALDQQRTAGLEFHSAIFTNLTQDHLDYHKKIKAYFLAKARLFSGLGRSAFAVLNSDDRFYSHLRKLTRARIFSYGVIKDAAIRANDIRFSSCGTEFLLSSAAGDMSCKTNLIGRHNLYLFVVAMTMTALLFVLFVAGIWRLWGDERPASLALGVFLGLLAVAWVAGGAGGVPAAGAGGALGLD